MNSLCPNITAHNDDTAAAHTSGDDEWLSACTASVFVDGRSEPGSSFPTILSAVRAVRSMSGMFAVRLRVSLSAAARTISARRCPRARESLPICASVQSILWRRTADRRSAHCPMRLSRQRRNVARQANVACPLEHKRGTRSGRIYQ